MVDCFAVFILHVLVPSFVRKWIQVALSVVILLFPRQFLHNALQSECSKEEVANRILMTAAGCGLTWVPQGVCKIRWRDAGWQHASLSAKAFPKLGGQHEGSLKSNWLLPEPADSSGPTWVGHQTCVQGCV